MLLTRQTSTTRPNRLRAPAGAGVTGLVVLLGLSGCSAPSTSLELGDCLRDPSAGSRSIHVVDCEAPHRGQVVGLYEPIGGPYPGIDLLSAEAELPCEEAFEEFIGTSPLTSVFDLFPLIPSEQAWEEGDTLVACIAAIHGEGESSSSFEDSHR